MKIERNYHVRGGRKLTAIKELRSELHVSLYDAKQIIDACWHAPVVLPGSLCPQAVEVLEQEGYRITVDVSVKPKSTTTRRTYGMIREWEAHWAKIQSEVYKKSLSDSHDRLTCFIAWVCGELVSFQEAMGDKNSV